MAERHEAGHHGQSVGRPESEEQAPIGTGQAGHRSGGRGWWAVGEQCSDDQAGDGDGHCQGTHGRCGAGCVDPGTQEECGASSTQGVGRRDQAEGKAPTVRVGLGRPLEAECIAEPVAATEDDPVSDEQADQRGG